MRLLSLIFSRQDPQQCAQSLNSVVTARRDLEQAAENLDRAATRIDDTIAALLARQKSLNARPPKSHTTTPKPVAPKPVTPRQKRTKRHAPKPSH